MIDVNNTNSFLHPKIVGQSIEDSEHFRATNNNFANRNTTSNNEFKSKDDDYEYCPNCSRKFFVGRLALHLKSCKEGKPLKPVKTKANNEKPGSLTDDNNELPGGHLEKTPELDRKRSNPMSSMVTQQSTLQERSQELVNRYLQSALMENDSRQATQESYYKKSNLYDDYNQKFKEVTFQHREEDAHKEEEDVENVEDRQEQGEEQEQEQEQGVEEMGDRVPCGVCGRKFAADRVEKHEIACKKSSKKRKVFDTSKQRAIPEQGEVKAAVKYEAPKNKKAQVSAVKEEQNEEEKPQKKVPAWKIEHENFIKNIKFNRKIKAMEAAGEDTTGLVAPTIVNENYVPCPHCSRKFAPTTAERHIPKCKNTFNRPKPPKNLNLDKMEEMQRVDRAKVNYILKKGASHRISPSEGDLRKLQNTVNDMSTADNTQNLSHRSPQSAISNRAASQHEDKTPKGGSQKPPTNSKSGSKLLIKKQNSTDIGIKRANTIERKMDNEDEPTTPIAYEVKFEKKTSYRAQSPGEKRVFIEAMPKKEDLLQNYQSIYERANTNSMHECPHCSRKFNSHAAQRHIPICQDLKTRPLKKVIDRTNSKEEKEKGDMKGTLMGTKFGFRKQGDNEETTQNKTSAAGGFYNKQGSKQSDRPPLPGKKPISGLLETCEPIMEKTSMAKTKIGGAAGSINSFCTSCGSKFVKTHKFCGYCGNKK